ncbi:carboxypeptidase-like regulatory domain-containing protein [Bacteroides xylanisolvens]|nr:carboxypeptidase-like regulatory domain-containing protein [Bacteroides xylanisolvens]UVR74018.1 carboxypeptidase-like regulatory domain-containing protein [Bacteroides xylanisolvens]
MKKIYILTLLLCFTSLGSSFAQTLKGHIYDANTNEPLVGAAVTYKLQGNQGVVSDIHGAYEIKLPEGGCRSRIQLCGLRRCTDADRNRQT